MNKNQRIKILKYLQHNNKTPTTELKFNSPFELLISVILSAKSTDISVNKVTNKLFKTANTPEAIVRLGVNGIKEHIKTIGLFNLKSKYIYKTCQILISNHNSKIPENKILLEALPGVGRKTSNIILNTIFNWPTIAVDTHIFRVCNRTHFATGKTVLEVEKKLLKVVPKKFIINFHNWFLLHGKNVCLSKKPNCNSCIIKNLCDFKK
ncbi:Endonuclease III [Candidatus Providencia siddallii]|uniref:Endonuclease III n=1 Tax=Candidatus Providencia siddallii TaxID=1715285 RepID=A0A0M6W900_9GAMM|nr:Endonuclease III [Candidatus Providencia siddallii]